MEQERAAGFLADELARRFVGRKLWPWLGPAVAAPLRLAGRAYRRRQPVDVLACLARPRRPARVSGGDS